MKQKEKLGIGERLCRAIELPAEVLPGKTLIEIHGESLLKVQGGGSILFYTDEEIHIRLGRGGRVLCVKGKNLCCSSFNLGALGIDGRIRSLEFKTAEQAARSAKERRDEKAKAE